ncbi:MAG TPA: thioesterase family protein [Daejeonella sp.]|nr:thioesterase family protein [Daejeonella sp.]
MTPFNGFNYKTIIPIRFADIDAFGHVNNAAYLTYFEIARTAYWKNVIQWNWELMGIILGKAEINYLKPIHLDDKIFAYVRTSRIGNSSFDLDYALTKEKNGTEILCSTGNTVCITFDYRLNQNAPIPKNYRQRMQEFELLSI